MHLQERLCKCLIVFLSVYTAPSPPSLVSCRGVWPVVRARPAAAALSQTQYDCPGPAGQDHSDDVIGDDVIGDDVISDDVIIVASISLAFCVKVPVCFQEGSTEPVAGAVKSLTAHLHQAHIRLAHREENH